MTTLTMTDGWSGGQDTPRGQLHAAVTGRMYNFRTSTTPTSHYGRLRLDGGWVHDKSTCWALDPVD